MEGMKIVVRTPFRFCEKCRLMDIDNTAYYAHDQVAYNDYFCSNYNRCEYIIGLYKQENGGAHDEKGT